MVKKHALIVFALLVSLLTPTYGLGLGDIKVNSNLNDPLDAEIKLLQLQGLTAGEVIPTLASNEDFRRAGIDRNFFLANIQFLVGENDAGQLVVALSTRQAVREPFLNFLVELNWPGGRLLKEYTILLDPPVFDTDLTPDALTIEAATASVFEPLSLTTSTVVESQEPVTPAVNQPVTRREFDDIDQNEYRVKRDDTLWEIALAVPGRQGYSPQQVMLAIQDLNPQSFLNNNINRLKAGSVLTLPTTTQIAARTLQEAVAEVQAQNRGSAPVLRDPVTGQTEVQLSATDNTASALVGSDEQRDPDGYLELSATAEAETATASGETNAVVDQLQNQLNVAEELNDQFERERTELESRVSELQAQLAIMERMLEVQNADMARVQDAMTQQADEAEMNNDSTVVEETMVASVEQEISDTVESITETMDEMVDAANETTDEITVADNLVAEIDEANLDVESLPSEFDSLRELADPEFNSDVEDVAVVSEAPVVNDTTNMQTDDRPAGLFAQIGRWISSSTTNMLLVLGSLVLLIAIPLYLRNKNQNLADVEEEPLDEDIEPVAEYSQPEDIDLLAMADEPIEEAIEEPELEKLADVEEAEMYMAYQNYDQAEGHLLKALEVRPGDTLAGLKLLEVYVETSNADAFNKVENDFSFSSEQQLIVDQLRGRLISSNTAENDLLIEDDLNVSLDESLDLSSDMTSDLDTEDLPDIETLGSALELDSESDDALNFDLDLDAPIITKPSLDESSEALTSEDLDFNLDLDEPSESVDEVTATENEDLLLSTEDDELLDLDLDDDLDFNLDGEELGLDLDLTSTTDELDSNSDADDEVSLDLSEDLESVEAEDLELDLDGDLDLDFENETSIPNLETDVNLSESDNELIDFDAEDDLEAFVPVEEVKTPESESKLSIGNDDLDIENLDIEDLESLDLDLDSELSELDSLVSSLESEIDLDSANIEPEVNEGSDREALGSVDVLEEPEEAISAVASEEETESLNDLATEIDEAEDALESVTELEALDGVQEADSSEEVSVVSDELTDIEELAEEDEDDLGELAGEVSSESTFEEDQDDELGNLGELDDLEDDDFDFLSGNDEASTKLDLARAYIEMEDSEGARDILEEVAQEGNEEQKAQAKALIESL